MRFSLFNGLWLLLLSLYCCWLFLLVFLLSRPMLKLIAEQHRFAWIATVLFVKLKMALRSIIVFMGCFGSGRCYRLGLIQLNRFIGLTLNYMKLVCTNATQTGEKKTRQPATSNWYRFDMNIELSFISYQIITVDDNQHFSTVLRHSHKRQHNCVHIWWIWN